VKKVRAKITKDLPIVLSHNPSIKEEFQGFPVEHYSYSMFTLASTNPLMFKIRYINREVIDTTTSVSAVLGNAVHRAMQAYLGGEKDIPTPADEGEAIKHGHARGLEYLKAYSDGFINWTSNIPTRTVLEEKYAFCYFGYIKDFGFAKKVKEIINVEKKLKYRIEVEGQNLPVPLVGVPDFVYEDFEGRIKIEDHKIVATYSKEDDIDGAKLLQAIFLYFLVYADTGKAPYSCTFREFKHTKNADGSNQTREYTIVYEEVPMAFELFYRFYGDITDMLLGKMIYLPNIKAMFDKEVSILAYIYRLDIAEERNQAFKKLKVDNLTDFLKLKIQKDGSVKKYMETVTAQFISSQTLNYKDMKVEERIKMKMAEHGLGMDFHSKVEGYSVDLYRYDPSIGLKMSKIEQYAKDIEQVVEVSGIRVLAPIPDSGLVGFEVPRKERRFPTIRPVAGSFEVAIGVDIFGKGKRIDIREAPHMLVAGATGSGKSVFLGSLIKQLKEITNAQLVLLDPKMVELIEFADSANVVYECNPKKIEKVLRGLVKEMETRYEILQKAKVRNIVELPSAMPYIFVVIDEFGDLVTGKDSSVSEYVLLLAQKARACGIHIILTTQRPSVKIVTGDVKANFPTRIAFRTATSVDSMVILDQTGAEKLLGKGDMLLSTAEGITRLQGFNL